MYDDRWDLGPTTNAVVDRPFTHGRMEREIARRLSSCGEQKKKALDDFNKEVVVKGAFGLFGSELKAFRDSNVAMFEEWFAGWIANNEE
jgi:hypothetical protein